MRLRRARPEHLLVRRVRRGRGFAYLRPDGTPWPDDEVRERALHLAIPPNWQNVRIAPHPAMHLQAVGEDAAGRQQYLYHPDWERRRTARKERQLALLAAALPTIRRAVARGLTAPAGSRQLALAIGVALIDRTAMRIGRERYLDQRGTRGAGTLYSRDVRIEGDELVLTFPAKSGKLAQYRLHDPALAAAITAIKTIPGRRLLMVRDESGAARALWTEDINRYLRTLAGAPVTAKDFRTLHASALAAEHLAQVEPGPSAAARRRQLAAASRRVADFLHNTPSMARKSYIAPCLFVLFEKTSLQDLWRAAAPRHAGIRAREARLAHILAQGR